MTYHPFEQERQWRHRAEELRTIGETCECEAVRHTYVRLAGDYDRLADRAAEAAQAETNRQPPKNPEPPTSLYRSGSHARRVLQ